jgi:dCMP deaminase
MRSSILMLYVPVIHRGYLRFFEKHRDNVYALYLPGAALVERLTFLEPEIRAIEPSTAQHLIRSLNLFHEVRVMDVVNMPSLTGKTIISADEGFSRRLVETYFPENDAIYDPFFLRWDEANVTSQQPVDYDASSDDLFDLRMMERAREESTQSGDWWRQVGGVLVRDGEELLTGFNHHVPSQHTPYMNGDPRDSIAAGQHSELSTALHFEQGLIAEAARLGIGLEGTSLYLTAFPCPVCAKMVAYSGIKTVYFGSGHASLDGQTIMQARGVRLVYVPET